MDLLERYLQAVRWALPVAKADDIIAELRDVLLARREDREESLGRALTAGETSALLKDFGHPLIVASRYRPQQWLIGPDVFPFYIFVMRIVVLAVVAIQIAVAAGRALFGGHLTRHLLGQTTGGLWMSLLVNIGIVTLIFAVMERAGFPADHLRRWKPEQLPDLHHQPKRAWEAGSEIAMGIVFLLWWVGAIHLPVYTNVPNFRMEPAPIFAELYWPILALAATRLIQNLIGWARPRWIWTHALLLGLTTVAGLALLAVIHRAGQWAIIIPTGMPAAKAAELSAAINLGLGIAIIAVAAVWAWQGVVEVWRLIRRGRG